MKNIKEIEKELFASLTTHQGVRVKATGMGSGSHRYWLTGEPDDYKIHCYGQGNGWSDQSDDCITQDVSILAKKLWHQRADILG